MKYELPPVETLAKYMALLRRAIVAARSASYHGCAAQAADLLDAVENLPDLLMRWSDFNEAIVVADLRRVEATYPDWSHAPFSKIVAQGAPEDWQLRHR